MEMDVEFEGFLRRSNLADNTIKAYVYAVKQYCGRYDKVTKSNLQKYKLFLLENYKPKTVNLRIRAVNCYLEAIGKEKLALSCQGTTEDVSGKCNQRRRLYVF